MKALVYGRHARGAGVAARARRRRVLVDRSLGNEHDLSLLDGVDVLVKSPACRATCRGCRSARPGDPGLVGGRARLPVLAPGTKFVGVTGTNGKSTTTALLGAVFEAAGRDVAVAGNIGVPITSVERADWVVCELSSFQLEDVHELACDVAVLLNLEPDHLDRYGTLRRLPRREAAHLRARAGEGRAARARRSTGSSSRRTTRCRRSR